MPARPSMTTPRAEVTIQDPEGKSGVFECPHCETETNHSLLAIVNSRHSDDSGLIDFFDHYVTARCSGCGSINFCHESSNTAEEDVDEEGHYFLAKKRVMYPPTSTAEIEFVSSERQQQISTLESNDFDLSKLHQLVHELNKSYAAQSYYSTLFALRAILDHVPPLFGCRSFSEVANNYSGGGRSFKDSMQHLENASRRIADSHLHTQMRRAESLPNNAQVEFRADLDLLLAEIGRVLRDESSPRAVS